MHPDDPTAAAPQRPPVRRPPAPDRDPAAARVRRQAVVVVHGMGEQKPGDTLRGFIDAALPRVGGMADYFSRQDTVTDSYEARRYLSPRRDERPQTEFFEYHWAHLMQGNRLDDLWPTFRRILLLWPWRVPNGLFWVWLGAWAAIGWVAWTASQHLPELVDPAGEETVWDRLGALILGVGVASAVVSYVIARLLPRWLTTSFVDVARYLDTSPRSYQVRRDIRHGFVELLRRLHDAEVTTYRGRVKKYDRIVVVAHSLGAYIAYDGIVYLWGERNHDFPSWSEEPLPEVAELEAAASGLPVSRSVRSGSGPGEELARYLAAKRRLWAGLRAEGHSWRVTDLVTLGTPMYFADRLAARGPRDFAGRVARGELPVDPPIPDPARPAEGAPTVHPRAHVTWRTNRRVPHEAAPFAVVRWTNAWFPARFRFWGDWFGGRLAPLFGRGVLDVEVRGNRRLRPPIFTSLFPGAAHAFYFKFPGDVGAESVTRVLRDALDLPLASFPDEVRGGSAR